MTIYSGNLLTSFFLTYRLFTIKKSFTKFIYFILTGAQIVTTLILPTYPGTK